MTGDTPSRAGVGEEGFQPGVPLQDAVDVILEEWARERPDLDVSPVAIVTRLMRLRLHLDAALRAVFERYDLSAADFAVIASLRRAGVPYRLPQNVLMERLGRTSGTISVRIDRLVRKGVVSREPDPEDARGVHIALSDHGLELFDAAAPVHLANEDRLLSALGSEERSTLARLLRTLLLSYEYPAVRTPWGMTLAPAPRAREMRVAVGLSDRPGLLVTEVDPGGTAAGAGVRRGDLLIAANGRELRAVETLLDAAARRPDTVDLELVRGEVARQVRLMVSETRRGS
ncbi:MAG: MarR family transcriptional regulator [Chloroflexi bacterium]|nr:MarR family transcriptional regulator [Chloroflexota bacterium]